MHDNSGRHFKIGEQQEQHRNDHYTAADTEQAGKKAGDDAC